MFRSPSSEGDNSAIEPLYLKMPTSTVGLKELSFGTSCVSDSQDLELPLLTDLKPNLGKLCVSLADLGVSLSVYKEVISEEETLDCELLVDTNFTSPS